MVKSLLALTLLTLTALSAEMRFCVQVAAERDLERLKAYFHRVKDFPEARIEKRGDVFLLRVGAEEKREDLSLVYAKIRTMFRDAYIKKCEIDPAYVVFPEKSTPAPVQTAKTAPPAPSPDGKGVEELERTISSLREEIKELRKEIEKLGKEKEQSSSPPPFPVEKFALSAGIFIGGLFLFTWFLLILVYRRIGSNNVENANLLNDVLKLIKILNLLSRGNVVKMENGRLMVYDRKNDRWREVE